MEKYIDIVFDGPPSHESGRFVEVENDNGASINFGEWVHREDNYWALRIPDVADLRTRLAEKERENNNLTTWMHEMREELNQSVPRSRYDAAEQRAERLTIALENVRGLAKKMIYINPSNQDVYGHFLKFYNESGITGCGAAIGIAPPDAANGGAE